MSPVLFHLPEFLGGRPIPSYGVMQFVGMLLGSLLFAHLVHRAGRPRMRGFEAMLETILVSVVVSKLAGALLAPASSAPFFSRLVHSSGIWYVGFLTGIAWLGWRAWQLQLPTGVALDLAAPAVALGHAFGRIGCLLGGCCWGSPSSVPWAVTFTEEAHRYVKVPWGVPMHPTQAYDAMAELAMAGLFTFVVLRGPTRYGGRIALAYIGLYSVSRFVIEFFRDDPRGGLGPLSTSQAIALACIAVTGTMLVLRSRAPRDA